MMKIKKSTILSIALSLTSIFVSAPVAAQDTVRSLGVKTVSWYGPGLHGRKTANGERFNQHAMTAAHRSLPFGTKLKVTCISTGKSAIVTVNDRGPFYGNRSLDLSKGAAKAIGLIDEGVGKVKIDILK